MKVIMILLIIDLLYLGIKFLVFYCKESDKDYFQTGFYVANLDKFHKKIFRFLCGIITKHPPSKTEWGYGGGDYADRWCRWCDKQYQMPKESVYFTHPNSKSLMKQVAPNGHIKVEIKE
jgi:hypothetical protein